MEEIVTGEAVVLDLPCARFPARILARIIDMTVELVLIGVIALLVGSGMASILDSAASTALMLSGLVLVIVGYPVAFETLSRGRTLGKMALGLRVVADDGGPERFRQALVRALAGAIECWAFLGVLALPTSILSGKGKRLGDIFAGTFVIRERAPQPAAGIYLAAPARVTAGPGVPHPGSAGPGAALASATPVDPGLRPWAASLDLSALPDQLAASAASYLSRYWQLNSGPRDAIGRQLAADVAARVSPPPPPGLAPAPYLHTVLAERRNRELARLLPSSGPWQPSPPPPAPAGGFPGWRR